MHSRHRDAIAMVVGLVTGVAGQRLTEGDGVRRAVPDGAEPVGLLVREDPRRILAVVLDDADCRADTCDNSCWGSPPACPDHGSEGRETRGSRSRTPCSGYSGCCTPGDQN